MNTEFEGSAQDYCNSNIFLKPLFRGNLDEQWHLNFHCLQKEMVRRLGLGKNNHLSYASLALNPRDAYSTLQGPVVQSIVNLTSLLMTNLLTVVAKVFSNTLIFLLQKLLTFFQQKISVYLPYFKIEIFTYLSTKCF